MTCFWAAKAKRNKCEDEKATMASPQVYTIFIFFPSNSTAMHSYHYNQLNISEHISTVRRYDVRSRSGDWKQRLWHFFGGEGHSSSVAGLNVGEAHCCARRGHFAWNWNHDASQSQLLEDLLRYWEENRTLRAALAALRDIGNSCGLKKSERLVILHTIPHLMEGWPLNETFTTWDSWDLQIWASFA